MLMLQRQTPDAPDEDDAGVWGYIATITTFPPACRPPMSAENRVTSSAQRLSAGPLVFRGFPVLVAGCVGREGHAMMRG